MQEVYCTSASPTKQNKGVPRTFSRPPRPLPSARREPGIEIEPVFFLDVKADERRIGNDQAVVIDIRQLAFWRLAIPAAIFAILKTSEFQQQHDFDNEGTSIWKPEVRPERVERDHGSGLSLI